MNIGNGIVILGAILVAVGVLGGEALPWFVLEYSEIAVSGMDFNLGLAFLGLSAISLLFSIACIVARDRVLAISSTFSAILIMVSQAYYFFEIRTILWGVDAATGLSLAPEAENVLIGSGFSLVFWSSMVMLVGTLTVFAAEFKWDKEQALLRAAVILNGAIIDERILLEQRDLIVGGEPKKSLFETGWFFFLLAVVTLVLPAVIFGPMISDYAAMRRNRRHLHIPSGKFPGGKQLFRVARNGNVTIGLTSEMEGKIHSSGKQMTVKEFITKTTGGASGLNYAPLEANDWGILDFGSISLFFQVTPIDQTVPKRSFWAFDKNVAATTLFSFLLQFGLIGSTLFFWEETAMKADQSDIRKIMKVEVQVSEEEEEEEIIEDGKEEDDAGKKAAGEEGKFGDPEIEPEKESKVPKMDGKMVDKIDVRNIGMNKLLNEATSTAISSILDDNAAMFENKIAVAMSGTGSEFVLGHGSGGMGFRGSGDGGGGTGFGRIHGLAKVDTGGGTAVKTGLGKKKAKKVSNLKLGSGASQGFCSKSDIRNNVRRRAGAIRACFERQLQIKPKLAGKVTVRWMITDTGNVDASSTKVVNSSLKDSTTEGCILRSIRRMRFKKPESGVCVIQWPFVFTNNS